ncbi:SGNH/GDSL hydrolase family protein [Hyalangium sp.]|uniref:SGNH/GDSL hydrolase family protein n=1 Tax=Hyalangium sp. TaxID=2028555 RepID=UPI002D33D0D3|nr:SGNH/GDSL hydrolase family protein [Hyalangium sp.]HYI01362.1 SGNH/GDSL hydrolase family protein [Hyalangium sp.]
MPRLLTLALLLLAVEVGAQAQYTYPGRTAGTAVVQMSDAVTGLLPSSLVTLGDSIGDGFCNDTPPYLALAALLPGYLASNRAQSGTTTSQIADRYFATRDTACAGERCGAYLFQGGVNNFRLGTGDTEQALEDMLSAVDDARELGRRVVWTNIGPFRGCGFCTDTATGWALAQEYNALWAAACAARPDITCIDVGSGSAWEEPETDGYLLTAWSCDGIHWLQGATDEWAEKARLAFPE